MNRLKGQVAIVTEDANGIGQAISELFTEEGAWVLVADIEEQSGEATAAAKRQKGGEAVFRRCDVTSKEDVRRAVALASEKTGRIDVLCNNAAYLGQFHGVLGPTDEEWNRSVRASLMGAQTTTGKITASGSARQVQLGLKLIF